METIQGQITQNEEFYKMEMGEGIQMTFESFEFLMNTVVPFIERDLDEFTIPDYEKDLKHLVQFPNNLSSLLKTEGHSMFYHYKIHEDNVLVDKPVLIFIKENEAHFKHETEAIELKMKDILTNIQQLKKRFEEEYDDHIEYRLEYERKIKTLNPEEFNAKWENQYGPGPLKNTLLYNSVSVQDHATTFKTNDHGVQLTEQLDTLNETMSSILDELRILVKFHQMKIQKPDHLESVIYKLNRIHDDLALK